MYENELIARAGRGDLSAFNRLVETYQTLAYNVAYRSLGDPDAAADATQDAFLSAWNGIRAFRGGSFKSWLLRIVTNACFDAGRRSRRRPATSLEALLDLPGGEDVVVDAAPLPEVEALSGEVASFIQASLLELPFEQRTAVILADLHGLSYEEIAGATSASLGTVKSRINRGRLRLREVLQTRPELLPDRYRP